MTKTTNSTDATSGLQLRVRVQAREHELQAALAKLAPDARERTDIQAALNEVTGLLTGNLDQIPRVVAAELNTWLEANKHVAEQHLGTPAPAPERR